VTKRDMKHNDLLPKVRCMMLWRIRRRDDAARGDDRVAPI